MPQRSKLRKSASTMQTHQKIFINLHVSVIMSKICSAMQRRKSFFISLIDFSAIIQQMMKLYKQRVKERERKDMNERLMSNLFNDIFVFDSMNA